MTDLDKIVFKVKCGEKAGTAFLISAKRALTAFHVIIDHEQSDIIISDGRNEICKARLSDKIDTQLKRLDVALLELEQPLKYEKTINFVDFKSIGNGTCWCSRGFPASKNLDGDNLLEKETNIVNQQFSSLKDGKIDIGLEHDQKLMSYEGYCNVS